MKGKTSAPVLDTEQKYLKASEMIMYLVAVFFYTMMTGMMDSYRTEYLVNQLGLDSSQMSIFNTLINIIPFIFNLFITMYIDGRIPGKKGKFRPLVTAVSVPMAVLLVLTFIKPTFLMGEVSEKLLLLYIVTIAVGWSVCCSFGNNINLVAVVMTPNLKERDQLMSFRSISSAVGNSAPLVVVLVASFFTDDVGVQYIITASLCGAVGLVTMLLGMKVIQERVTYSPEKKNPLVGFADVVKNKNSWIIIISETLKNLRKISTSLGIFLCAALLGSPSKYLLFGLPTGIGTAVGMLVINFLLKKFNSKVLYIASGIYSVLANLAAFTVGYIYLNNPSKVLQIVFVAFLFFIGIQFGASNLLPNMFQADVLEEIESKTGKRLDASLPFVVGIGTLISGTVAQALYPQLLLGEGSVIGYIQAVEGEYPEQTLHTKIMLLFFYTIFHGIMMFLAGVPYFFWKLTGKRKEEVHNRVVAYRAKIAAEKGSAADGGALSETAVGETTNGETTNKV